MVKKEEVEEFLIRLGGGITGSLEDVALESYHKMHPELEGTFPYLEVLENKVAKSDDLIIGGLSIPPWVIGMLMEEEDKKRGVYKEKLGHKLKLFGEGNICYSVGMVLHHSILRCTTPQAWPPAAKVSGKTPASRSGRTLYV